MDENVLKNVQRVEVEILEMVHNICEENNIKYYLIAGSLLGAIRHKGFIPWDDDIDIAMPRNDYRKFIHLCQAGILGDKYILQDISTYPENHLSFAKVRKKNTLFDEYKVRNLDCPKGIFIDIFPLDYSKKNKGIIYHIKAKFIKDLSHVVSVRKLGSKPVSLINKILCFAMRPLSIKTIWAIRNRIASSSKCGNYYINYGSWYNYIKETIPIDYFGNPVLVDFEDKQFYTPKQSHLILTQIYGDYMTLPPIEKRINHNPTRVVFNLEEEDEQFTNKES